MDAKNAVRAILEGGRRLYQRGGTSRSDARGRPRRSAGCVLVHRSEKPTNETSSSCVDIAPTYPALWSLGCRLGVAALVLLGVLGLAALLVFVLWLVRHWLG